MSTHLIIRLDGLGLACLGHAAAPTLDKLGRLGWRTVSLGAAPSVTNVNNVSIITSGPGVRQRCTASRPTTT